ncbi:hypothetical protein PYW07_010150 [Mythimna separata]|uniref:Uncharacterized protein n=1 Tax=Mythimna separata TaxID=271217 RepID=A0AAD8DRF7_MYTSE|nr:hypothetical protein PYW07_010150 [Mythimna separata]
MSFATAAAIGLAIVSVLVYLRWKWISQVLYPIVKPPTQELEVVAAPVTLVHHRLCPHHNVVQGFELEEKDSLDEHLDILTRKLADKEGRLRLSKSKIQETQNEIQNLHAIDYDVKTRYREIMESLRSDLLNNEKECKKLQEQIEWVSQRRAELKDEVNRGQILYGEAAAELASSLAELQRGRVPEQRVTEKPRIQYTPSLRCRQIPRTTFEYSIKNPHHFFNTITTSTSNSNQTSLID